MRSRSALLAYLFLGAAFLPASASELKVLTAGAYKPILVAMAATFEKDIGHVLKIENDTAGALERRIAQGESFDVVIMPPGGLERLVKSGRVVDGSALRLARVAIGVAVRRGDPAPDITTPAAFRQALLSARAVAYIDPAAGGSSGIYLSQLFERWGIAAQLAPKAVLVPGGLVAERLVTGEADLAVHQVSEILAVPGATLVGPLPDEIQNFTSYSGAVGASTMDAAAAAALLTVLGGPAARDVLRDKGMMPPP